jgi:hypothetical protein
MMAGLIAHGINTLFGTMNFDGGVGGPFCDRIRHATVSIVATGCGARRRIWLRPILVIVLAIAPPLGSAAQHLTHGPDELRMEDASGKTIIAFTAEQLRSTFEQQTYDTRTPWTGEHETIVFRGPLLETVLERAGLADAPSFKIVAYDDFIAEVPRADILSYKPILAVQRKCSDIDRATARCAPGQDFRPIDLLEKGPIFVVWPFDQLPSSYIPARNAIWVFFPIIVRAIR